MTWHKFHDIVRIRENYNLKYAEAITEIDLLEIEKLFKCKIFNILRYIRYSQTNVSEFLYWDSIVFAC